jgi:hypothetical protein
MTMEVSPVAWKPDKSHVVMALIFGDQTEEMAQFVRHHRAEGLAIFDQMVAFAFVHC